MNYDAVIFDLGNTLILIILIVPILIAFSSHSHRAWHDEKL